MVDNKIERINKEIGNVTSGNVNDVYGDIWMAFLGGIHATSVVIEFSCNFDLKNQNYANIKLLSKCYYLKA